MKGRFVSTLLASSIMHFKDVFVLGVVHTKLYCLQNSITNHNHLQLNSFKTGSLDTSKTLAKAAQNMQTPQQGRLPLLYATAIKLLLLTLFLMSLGI